jgi:Tfp pilus assembly pilus retraction ATPase PilT
MSGKVVKAFEEEGEADFSYAVAGVGRFRVNAFMQRGAVFVVMRFIPFGVPKFEDLNLPEVNRQAGARRAGHNPGYGDHRQWQVHDASIHD